MAEDEGGNKEAGSLADRIWLDVPYSQKDAAKAAGAKWDRGAKRWYAPESGMVDLEPWIRGSNPAPKPRFVQVAGKVWLDVPFEDNDAAKAAGARWDSKAKCWYAPRPGIAELERWASGPPLAELSPVVPGENRDFGSSLYIDLVPSSCWFTNVRSSVTKREWDRIRRMVYKRANHECEICGAAPAMDNRVVPEAHERFSYDEWSGVQKLERLICLCRDCHTASHFGLATIQGKAEQAEAHMRKVNHWSAKEFEDHMNEAGTRWSNRSKRTWILDLSILEDAGIELRERPQTSDRAVIAARELEKVNPDQKIMDIEADLIPKEFRVQL
ncbi:MAG: DUF5710 domain-containing protein [Actinomycetota bacterium]|nr:DUF5710 domain-containing protein [Actinomycetota bacterium]MDA8375263.1 DUF5710 domain-containing protein [Actinomycetota bacterium]